MTEQKENPQELDKSIKITDAYGLLLRFNNKSKREEYAREYKKKQVSDLNIHMIEISNKICEMILSTPVFPLKVPVKIKVSFDTYDIIRCFKNILISAMSKKIPGSDEIMYVDFDNFSFINGKFKIRFLIGFKNQNNCNIS